MFYNVFLILYDCPLSTVNLQCMLHSAFQYLNLNKVKIKIVLKSWSFWWFYLPSSKCFIGSATSWWLSIVRWNVLITAAELWTTLSIPFIILPTVWNQVNQRAPVLSSSYTTATALPVPLTYFHSNHTASCIFVSVSLSLFTEGQGFEVKVHILHCILIWLMWQTGSAKHVFGWWRPVFWD